MTTTMAASADSSTIDDVLDEATTLEDQIRNLLGDANTSISEGVDRKQEEQTTMKTTATKQKKTTMRRDDEKHLGHDAAAGGAAAAADPGTSRGNLLVEEDKPFHDRVFLPRSIGSKELPTSSSSSLRDMVEDIMIEHNSEVRSDIQNVHVELLRQFQLQIVRFFKFVCLFIYLFVVMVIDWLVSSLTCFYSFLFFLVLSCSFWFLF